MFDEELTC